MSYGYLHPEAFGKYLFLFMIVATKNKTLPDFCVV